MDFPLRVSWYRDEELKLFAGLIKKWETGEEPKPTFVITGSKLKDNKTLPFVRHVYQRSYKINSSCTFAPGHYKQTFQNSNILQMIPCETGVHKAIKTMNDEKR